MIPEFTQTIFLRSLGEWGLYPARYSALSGDEQAEFLKKQGFFGSAAQKVEEAASRHTAETAPPTEAAAPEAHGRLGAHRVEPVHIRVAIAAAPLPLRPLRDHEHVAIARSERRRVGEPRPVARPELADISKS